MENCLKHVWWSVGASILVSTYVPMESTVLQAVKPTMHNTSATNNNSSTKKMPIQPHGLFQPGFRASNILVHIWSTQHSLIKADHGSRLSPSLEMHSACKNHNKRQ